MVVWEVDILKQLTYDLCGQAMCYEVPQTLSNWRKKSPDNRHVFFVVLLDCNYFDMNGDNVDSKSLKTQSMPYRFFITLPHDIYDCMER